MDFYFISDGHAEAIVKGKTESRRVIRSWFSPHPHARFEALGLSGGYDWADFTQDAKAAHLPSRISRVQYTGDLEMYAAKVADAVNRALALQGDDQIRLGCRPATATEMGT